ncbi:hypothetical protein PtB15_18B271 [Puccinia triticina]|nr:hypothetical protein PtB15_18B271 [Puccinia triticina]
MGAHSNCLKLSALLFAFFFLKAVQGSYLWGKLNWTQQSEDLTEKLIAEISQEDNGHSVTHILRSPSYNPSWTEQQDAKKHILGIIQMGNHRMIEPEKSGWEKQKMMKEDFNSLKHFSRGFLKLPQRLGDLLKDEDSKYDLCYGNFYRLKEIHTTMENLLPAFQVENSIIPNYKEIEDIFTRLLQELLGTVVQMSPTIKTYRSA